MAVKKFDINCAACPGRRKGVFCDLEGSNLNQLNNEKNANLYKKGQNLFLAGNPPFGLYCVHAGKVKISKTDAQGKETIVRIVGSGGILGHRSLLSSSPYKASATMLEDGKVCFVSKQTMFDLMKSDPGLSLKVIEQVTTEMGEAEDRLASMARKSTRERFAEVLLILSEGFGVQEEKRVKIDVKLTREELGGMVGAATENITRLISDFKGQDYIQLEGKVFYVTDSESLEEIAGLPY